MNIYLQL